MYINMYEFMCDYNLHEARASITVTHTFVHIDVCSCLGNIFAAYVIVG